MVYKKSDKTESRKDEKRKLIFETASKVFAEKGYNNTSIKDITNKAEVSVGTFYLYFKNKEELFEELYDHMEQIISNIKNYAMKKETSVASEKFANVVAASIWTYQKYRQLAKILLVEALRINSRFEERYQELVMKSCEDMEGILKRLKAIGIIDVPDVKVSAIVHEGSFNYAISYWLRTDDKTDFKEYCYPLAVSSLQSLKIEFSKEDIQRTIKSMFLELDKVADELIKFS
ncbi:TetR/AcrR family transcriptional regulator [Clostridium folliculivorans]|uniref:TetR family transcriptional regulator n=1 Tax=Clostridium folliculivorans TaxID=2886038 RepID=A0A9W6DAT1_9CLOT|nr:TetR/AcrR family transcriptional regulator [Clostridium folliculivorans]GKU24993.1 TetR family transcriptional regulator [Clostridium folliculivorans]GKU31091.1 TetR family transcriptional regulator [Clostridium folliculivorans]